MARCWKSQEKKDSLIKMKLERPDLSMKTLALQHGIAYTTAYQWWYQYQKGLKNG